MYLYNMLSFDTGRLLAKVKGGKHNSKLVYIDTKDDDTEDGLREIKLSEGMFVPLPDVDKREVVYIAGPSGSGKSTYAADYIKSYLSIFPDKDFFIFSRTKADDDPAFNKMKYHQVLIDESLLENPIDITQELTQGCIILFDDVNTIQIDALKKAVDKLMADIMECGRKLEIYCVITNHLVIPNEKKMARTVLNECTSLTVFPKSGSTQQIKYALKQYFGYSPKQITGFLENNKSRWITFYKTYPQVVMSQKLILIP